MNADTVVGRLRCAMIGQHGEIFTVLVLSGCRDGGMQPKVLFRRGVSVGKATSSSPFIIHGEFRGPCVRCLAIEVELLAINDDAASWCGCT